MKKLSKQEMKNVNGGTNYTLWECNYYEGGTYFMVCQTENPADHVDPTCYDVYSCISIGSCTHYVSCP